MEKNLNISQYAVSKIKKKIDFQKTLRIVLVQQEKSIEKLGNTKMSNGTVRQHSVAIYTLSRLQQE